MQINGKCLSLKKVFFLVLYYGFAYYLPNSYLPVVGKFFNSIRVFCVKRIFKECGEIRTINRKVRFSTGYRIVMGGVVASVPILRFLMTLLLVVML